MASPSPRHGPDRPDPAVASASSSDGTNTLRVSSKSAEASAQIVLAPCGLAVASTAARGVPRRLVSASAGIGSQLVRLPEGLRLHVARATLGTVSVQVDGRPAEAFSLFGARSRSERHQGPLKAHAIQVNHLPTEPVSSRSS